MALLIEKDFGTPASVSGEVIHLEIDGQNIQVPGGTSVMRAAELAGIDIPKLCATDTLEAFGSCKLAGAGVRLRHAQRLWRAAWSWSQGLKNCINCAKL